MIGNPFSVARRQRSLHSRVDCGRLLPRLLFISVALSAAVLGRIDAHGIGDESQARRAERRFFRSDADAESDDGSDGSQLTQLGSRAGPAVEQAEDVNAQLFNTVQVGTWLQARARSDVFASPFSWEKIGEIETGGTVVASGKPIWVEGYYMVPVDPTGAVQYGDNAFMLLDSVRDGTVLVAQTPSSIYRSTESWDAISHVLPGSVVYAAGPPAAFDGSIRVPLRPYGSVQLGAHGFTMPVRPLPPVHRAQLIPPAPAVVTPHGMSISSSTRHFENKLSRGMEATTAASLAASPRGNDHRNLGGAVSIAAHWEEARIPRAGSKDDDDNSDQNEIPRLKPVSNLFDGLPNAASESLGGAIFVSGSSTEKCEGPGASSACLRVLNDGLYGNQSWSPGPVGYNGGLFCGVRFRGLKYLRGIRVSFLKNDTRSSHGKAIVQVTDVATANHVTAPRVWRPIGRFTVGEAGLGYFGFQKSPPIIAAALRVVFDNPRVVVDELEVYGFKALSSADAATFRKSENIAARSAGGIPFGSGSFESQCAQPGMGEGTTFCGGGESCFCNINDGLFGNVGSAWRPNANVTATSQTGRRFVGIRFPSPRWLLGMRISRMGNLSKSAKKDRSAYCCRDGYSGTYTVQIAVPNLTQTRSDDEDAWITLGRFTRRHEWYYYFKFNFLSSVKTDAVRIVVSDPKAIIDELAVYGGQALYASPNGTDVRQYPNVGHRESGGVPFASGSLARGCNVPGPSIGFSAVGRTCFTNINDGVFGARSTWVAGNASVKVSGVGANFVGVRFNEASRVYGLRVFVEGQRPAGPTAPRTDAAEEQMLFGEDADTWGMDLDNVEPAEVDPVVERTRVNISSCAASGSFGSSSCEQAFDSEVNSGWSASSTNDSSSKISLVLAESSPTCGVSLFSGNVSSGGRITEFNIKIKVGEGYVEPDGLMFLDGANEDSISGNVVKVRGQHHVRLSFNPIAGATSIDLEVLRTDGKDGVFTLNEVGVEKDAGVEPIQVADGQGGSCDSASMETHEGSTLSDCYSKCAQLRACNYFFAVTEGSGSCILYNACSSVSKGAEYKDGAVFEMEDGSVQSTVLRGEASPSGGDGILDATRLDVSSLASSQGTLYEGVRLELDVKCTDARNCLARLELTDAARRGLGIDMPEDAQAQFKVGRWTHVSVPVTRAHYQREGGSISWKNMTRLSAIPGYKDESPDFSLRNVRFQRPPPAKTLSASGVGAASGGSYTILVTADGRSDVVSAPMEVWDRLGTVDIGGVGSQYIELAAPVVARALRVDLGRGGRPAIEELQVFAQPLAPESADEVEV